VTVRPTDRLTVNASKQFSYVQVWRQSICVRSDVSKSEYVVHGSEECEEKTLINVLLTSHCVIHIHFFPGQTYRLTDRPTDSCYNVDFVTVV
jgi:hypothetical protein